MLSGQWVRQKLNWLECGEVSVEHSFRNETRIRIYPGRWGIKILKARSWGKLGTHELTAAVVPCIRPAQDKTS